MSYTPSLLPLEFVEEATFRLLASSTVNRYVQVAESLAARAVDGQLLGPDSSWATRVMDVSRALWTRVLSASHREPEEAELAVALGMLAMVASPEVDRMLHAIAQQDRPPISWLGSLARSILRQRASNSVLILSNFQREPALQYFATDDPYSDPVFTDALSAQGLNAENTCATTSDFLLKAA